MMHIADNQDALLDYIYDEGDPVERLKIAKHLQECASCSVAVLELKTVRGMLADWTPPSPALGFRIVQDGQPSGPAVSAPSAAGSGVTRTAWHRWLGGSGWTWAQAAAAVMLFAAGMAVSQIRMEYRDGAVTLRTGSAQPSRPGFRGESIVLPADTASLTGAGLSPVSTAPRSVAFGGDQREAVPTSAAESTEQLLQRVRAMIEQSEVRQQRELALRLSQVANEVETQHRADVLRMQQNFGQLEIETGAQQQQIMDYLVRTSGGAK